MADLNQSIDTATSLLQKIVDNLLATPQAMQGGSQTLAQAQQGLSQFQSGAGQSAARQQMSLLQRLQLAQTELETAKARSQLDWIRSPQGRRQTQDQSRAEKERESVVRELQTQKMLATMSPLERFNKTLVDGARGASRFGSTLQMAAGTLMSLTGKASPMHAATLSGSMDMVAARLGKVLLPAVEAASRSLQTLSSFLDSPAGKSILGAARTGMDWGHRNVPIGTHAGQPGAMQGWSRWFGEMGYNLIRSIRGSRGDKDNFTEHIKEMEKGGWWNRQMAWFYGGSSSSKEALKPSLAGMGQPQETSADRYQLQLMMSGLTMGRNTTEADVQRKQWEEMSALLKGIGQSMDKVEHNTRRLDPFR